MHILLRDDVGGGGREHLGVALCDDGQLGLGSHVDLKIDLVASHQSAACRVDGVPRGEGWL
ncbi:hypothetical protein QC762_0034180 [Podospora pseudocomata]|uniref:Uncharacterized protein n=1 Tax=Podospora pseudocomata TaxID=2093779 RepID=A0ABR0GQR1_9PEZI|nr:hypothetical protein QC762_0034180 [Podospora pseudocomata]